MNRQLKSFTTSVLTSPLLRGGFALLILLAGLAETANGQSQVETSAASSSIHVKHVLGFEGVRRNAGGELSIQGDDLSFQQSGKPGGFHGAIFRLTKGQGQTIKSNLIAGGAKITRSEDPGPVRATVDEPLKVAEEWSVQVEKIDPGATTLDLSFSDAIYENIFARVTKVEAVHTCIPQR